jgi:Rrf2 family iron-sulfur cluster assembly transcriptional regulator
MKISTKGRYAVSALIEIVLSRDTGPITLSDLAAMQGISLSYAEQLFAGLRKQNLVKGTRGPGGGFALARTPEEITIAEIIRAVYDNDAENTGDELLDDGKRAANCWKNLDNRIDTFLEKITLADVIEPNGASAGSMSFGA